MTVGYEPLAALGRAHLGFCEQFARLALESFERAQRINLDAYKAFWAPRIAQTHLAAGDASPTMPGGAAASAFLEHWTRVNETASYLCEEFGRLAAEYAGEARNAASAAPDAAQASRDSVPAGRIKVPKSVEGALSKAA